MSLLVIGSTGTLGRQIVLQALTKGYKVRCLVRNFRKAQFLVEWGAELIYGDLTRPETIPLCLKGITAIIDASTSRPEELTNLKMVDWKGKLVLIEAAKVAKIKHFIFYSPRNLEEFLDIPLMKMKYMIENTLKKSTIPYTIFRLTGFYQGLIEQYAIAVLENLPIWITNEHTKISYMDTQDIAKYSLRSLQISLTKNQTFSLGGPQSWLSTEIISLCEELGGQTANINRIPLVVLQVISTVFGFFQWGERISDRLIFAKILTIETNFLFDLTLIKIFKFETNELSYLEDYFLEYFIRLLKRLKDLNFDDIEKQKKLVL